MKSGMRAVITLSEELHALAKQRAADLGISFSELARRLFEKELSVPTPLGDIDAICGMVTGTPFDMAVDGQQTVGEAPHGLHRQRGSSGFAGRESL